MRAHILHTGVISSTSLSCVCIALCLSAHHAGVLSCTLTLVPVHPRVLDEKPRRIFYKELKLVHTKVSGGGQSRYSDAGNSPGASPRAHSATASPLATSTPPAAAAAWRRTVSIEAAEAMPAAAAAPELTAVSVAAERAEEYGEGQVEVQPACSGADPACDPLYCRSPVICSTGHAYIGSGVASSGVRSSWSVGVSKGFRAMRTIPEAHKKQPGDCQAGPGASQASGLREGSPSCRRQGSPASLRASLDSRLASQAYPYHQAGRTRVTDRSPDRWGTRLVGLARISAKMPSIPC